MKKTTKKTGPGYGKPQGALRAQRAKMSRLKTVMGKTKKSRGR